MALFRSIWDDLKYSLRTGSMVTKLVVVNFAIFVAVNLGFVILWLIKLWTPIDLEYWGAIQYLCISSDWQKLLMRPWTIFTHFFLHVNVWHLVNNVFGLYLFGSIVGDLVGERRVLPLYLMGGLAGALVFFISANLSASFGDYALGASAAVMAMAGAALTLAPDYRVALLLVGEVKVKYIVLVFVLLDLVGIAGSNMAAGGNIAHLGGLAMGILFVLRLRDGKDMAETVNNLLGRLQNVFKSRPKTAKQQPKRKVKTAIRATMGNTSGSASSDHNDMSHQQQLDAILEKIKDSGYENLTQAEKDFLYDASKK